jgi:hypothetical protein
MPKRREFVFITWDDIVTDPGWGKGEKKPYRVISGGYIVEVPNKKQKRRCYRISSSFGEDGDVGDVTTIPEGCVVRIETLGLQKRPK